MRPNKFLLLNISQKFYVKALIYIIMKESTALNEVIVILN